MAGESQDASISMSSPSNRASDLAGLIIDRMDGPVGHVVAPCPRLQGVGLNPMTAFGTRFPRHDAYRTFASSVVLSGCEPSTTAPERHICLRGADSGCIVE
jgi:hypothetical protein